MPVCKRNTPIYFPAIERGLRLVASNGDGYTVSVLWFEAFADEPLNFRVAYNIYYSTVREDVFKEGPKFLSLNTIGLRANIVGFTPGDVFYFAVRATEYDVTWYDPNLLPNDDGYALKVYPESLLLSDISDTDLSIPIQDIGLFPPFGIVQIGYEIIRYIGLDIPTSSLLVGSIVNRGFLNTNVRLHTVDGYDGYITHDDPLVRFFIGCEDGNNFVIQEQSTFNDINFARTNSDGYKEKTKDLLNADFSASDADRVDFPSYDYAGWHRIDPVLLFKGACVGSYIGGEQGCSDGYLGVGRRIRGIPISEQADKREEILLGLTGEECVLLRRMWKGVVCSCYEINREYPEPRCPNCFGTGITRGYTQFFAPTSRNSSGRILVRFSPTIDDLEMQDAGLETKFIPNAWTLAVWNTRDRDILARYNIDGTEDARFEVLNVERVRLLFGETGMQKMTVQRVRKTDIVYQVPITASTSTMPMTLITTVGMVAGPGGIIPHSHEIRISENIVTISQINQMTSVAPNIGDGQHNHYIRSGVLDSTLGHTHEIILP